MEPPGINSWTVAAESGDWFPVMADYSQILATEENARLQSAAPDLLVTLKWLLSQISEYNKYEPLINAKRDAERAIAKAEGRAS